MQAVNNQYTAEANVPVQGPQGTMGQTHQSNAWTVFSGGLLAAAAAIVAVVYKGNQSECSEQFAMLAASGKKKVATPPRRAAPRSNERLLWYPNAEPAAWLDGSLPGDRGFDPLGLSKPSEYLQYGLDQLDQNAAKNRAGQVVGRVSVQADQVSEEALAPYSEVFGLQRLRECEVIHGRWAMLFALGAIVGEAVTGVAWQNAGLVEVTQGASYFNYNLPFTTSQITWFEVLTVGFVEIYRNTELNTEKRVYPGGPFDPLGLTTKNAEETFRLKEAELKHGRLAMIAFLGFAAAAARTGQGATEAFANWAVNIS